MNALDQLETAMNQVAAGKRIAYLGPDVSALSGGSAPTSPQALCAMIEAQVRGVAVPGDIAVIGFGDQEFAAHLEPGVVGAAGRVHGQLRQVAGVEHVDDVLHAGHEHQVGVLEQLALRVVRQPDVSELAVAEVRAVVAGRTGCLAAKKRRRRGR